MKKKQLNLTSGPILRTLSELALPIMASSFLSTAYNITDMAWISSGGCGRGRYVRLALPGTFFPGKNGRTGKHGAFPWKR